MGDCFNCKDSSSVKLMNGWKDSTGEYVQLCYNCCSIYKAGQFCEMFHSDEDGWRDCESCKQLIHCGCIVSLSDYMMHDSGGITCNECSDTNSRLGRDCSNDESHSTDVTDLTNDTDLKSVLTPLFEKVVSTTDSNLKTSRMRIPRNYATSMGKRRHNTSKEYTFDQNTLITSGDCVFVVTEGSVKPKVARVNQIYKRNRNGKTVFDITWYIWPDDTTCGRLVFQGKNELLSSNWNDKVTADSLIGKCTVHTFDKYEKLEEVGPNVFFSRSKYNHVTEAYDPEESLPVYCVCRWPCNPDYPMICCGKCNCWFHPSCIGVKSISEVAKLDEDWCCQSCK